jgi:DNA-binding transcriptional MerR regulator
MDKTISSSRFPIMAEAQPTPVELTYPLRTAARLTGLSPALLRAWERRYGIVVPQRTPGGTRRYSAADLERLKRVKAVVDAGHRIGEVARLAPEELERLAGGSDDAPPSDDPAAILDALANLDGAAAQRGLALQLATLGPTRFARSVALPLVREIGERWSQQRLGIASEHLATSLLRSLLGGALQPTAVSLRGPRIVFATPTGEPHELGTLIAALVALGAGAQPLYLGVDVPVDDLLDAADTTEARAVALGIVTLPRSEAERTVATLRAALPPEKKLWLGGAGAAALAPMPGVDHLASLDRVEQQVALLALEP